MVSINWIFWGKFCPKSKWCGKLKLEHISKICRSGSQGVFPYPSVSIGLGFSGTVRWWVFLAFVLVIGTDWQPWIKGYSVYLHNKCGFNKLLRNFCVHVSQHWAGIELVPCSCSHSHSDIPITSTKPAEMTYILWDDSRILSKERHCKLNKANSLLAILILLSWKHSCITQGFLHCSQLQYLWNLGIALYTYSYKRKQDLIRSSHSASYSVLVT